MERNNADSFIQILSNLRAIRRDIHGEKSSRVNGMYIHVAIIQSYSISWTSMVNGGGIRYRATMTRLVFLTRSRLMPCRPKRFEFSYGDFQSNACMSYYYFW